MSFEKTLQRLQEIVELLEKGDLPLEESLKLFEEGVTLARSGEKALNDAEMRVEMLLKDGSKAEVDVETLSSSDGSDPAR